METFTAIIKNVYASDKSRSVKIRAEDTWLAHKLASEHYNQLREDVVTIKDSRSIEVYNLEKGFLLES
ncbi:MAG: hypothetical protein EBU90_02405 [Proteobacteria bacterium]|nr:hypothetical protein [Pseudomonadota bacterium]NBP13087.1 hypothetical protein [bacterium]